MPQLYLKEVEPFLITPRDKKQERDGTHIGQQKVYSRHTTKRSTSLIATDAILLCLEFLQVLAILQAMSLKWIWPEIWIKHINFIFMFNADVWEFIKVDCGAFIGARNYDTPSNTVSTKFYYILAGWGAFFFLLVLIWAAIKIILHQRQPAYLLMHNARLQRAIVIILQVIALPFGVSALKVFHCTSVGQMSVDNSVECWSGLHWAYIVPVVVALLVVMVAFPVWLFWRIRHEAMASAEHHHEDFLKLKEVEYMSGLDVVWSVHGFHLFSSFRLRAIYYRPTVHLVKLLILVLYGATFQHITAQAVTMMVVLLLAALVVLALRPFRLIPFNVVMAMGLFCLTGDALFGVILTQFNPTQVQSPWLVEPYSLAILIALNGIFLLGSFFVFFGYLLAYRFCCEGRCVLEPLWPVMTAYEHDIEGVETQKYLAAVLRGRALIEKCRRLPSMFTPVHEIALQIQVLNAYMRESELLHDGLHPTLWAVVDEMIDMHHRLEPKSLFGEMVQESIRKNAAHFMTLMPMFAQRLAQRDYDLILVPPQKKRLLLKMYIIAMLMGGSRRQKTHRELTQRVLTSIWEESPEIVEVTVEREYHEDLYPDTIQGPDTEALYMTGTLDLGRGLYDLEAVEDEEESLASFLKRVPPTLVLRDEVLSQFGEEELSGADNPAFVPDDSEDQTRDDRVSSAGEEVQGYSEGQADLMMVTEPTDEPEEQPNHAYEAHDTSEGQADLVVATEPTVQSEDRGTEEATVELTDFEAGETSTDTPEQDAVDREDEGREDDELSGGRRNTGTSVTSTKSSSSAKSRDRSDASSKSSASSQASRALPKAGSRTKSPSATNRGPGSKGTKTNQGKKKVTGRN